MKNTIRVYTSHVSSLEETMKSIAKSLETYRKMSDLISASLSTMLRSYSAVPLLEFNSITESLRKTMDTYAKMNMTNFTSGLLTDSISASLQEIGKTFKLYERTNFSESLKAISESMSLFSESIASEQLRQLRGIDYSTLFANIMSQSSSLSQIVDTAYSMVQDELSEANEQDENFNEEEFQEVLQEQASNPKGFQERIAGWTDKKKIQFFIIWQLIMFIYGNFFQPYFQENIGMPVTAYVVSNVKELPQKGADIICQLKENVEAIIIENTNYYYKVSFIDENGEKREGYVAKRNLKDVEEETQYETEGQQEEGYNEN